MQSIANKRGPDPDNQQLRERVEAAQGGQGTSRSPRSSRATTRAMAASRSARMLVNVLLRTQGKNQLQVAVTRSRSRRSTGETNRYRCIQREDPCANRRRRGRQVRAACPDTVIRPRFWRRNPKEKSRNGECARASGAVSAVVGRALRVPRLTVRGRPSAVMARSRDRHNLPCSHSVSRDAGCDGRRGHAIGTTCLAVTPSAGPLAATVGARDGAAVARQWFAHVGGQQGGRRRHGGAVEPRSRVVATVGGDFDERSQR
jgi:hypothetical protein